MPRSVPRLPWVAFVLACSPASLLAAQEPLFTFAQVSDSQPQTAEENQRFVDVLRTIAEAGQAGSLLPRPVDLVLFAGDITWGNTRSEWTAATQKLDTWLTANDIPFLAVPGNHDVNNADTALYEEFIGSSDVWDAPSAAFTGQNGRSRSPGWRGLRFIGFNNSNPGWNTISSTDLAAIDARVTSADLAQENVFLLCHHPHNEKARLPLADVLPNPSAVGYLHGHSGSAHVTRGLAGIVNPNIWDCNTNAIYADRCLLYYQVFPTELRVHVLVLDLNPTTLPAPVVVPLVHPLAPASEPGSGTAGPFHLGARAEPTGRAPEHKLWFEGGSWWGVLWSDARAAWRIQRLDLGTQTWLDTGPTVSTQSARSFDAWAQGGVLVLASNVPTQPGTAGNGSPGQVSRFDYSAGTGSYTPAAGFPVAVNDARSPTLVVDRDSTGRLWTAWTRGGAAIVNHSAGADDLWAAPITLASGLGAPDTAAVAALDGALGVLWSNSSTGTLAFARHLDGAADDDWSLETVTSQAALVGTALDLTGASGRFLAAVRAASGELNLFERTLAGTWNVHPIAASSAQLADPALVVDQGFGLLRVFASAPTPGGQSVGGGGALYEKVAPLATLGFPPGRGSMRVLDGLNPSCRFATVSRAAVSAVQGLLVLGSVSQTERYRHAFDPLAAPPAPPLAEFSASPLLGQAPLVVAFQDLSTGAPSYWDWDFGDGNHSQEPEPQHAYAQAGLYTVALRVANGGGEDVRTRVGYIEVEPPSPVQTFTPVADARVSEGSPGTNAGTDVALRVKTQAGSSYQSFLRFDVGTLSGTLTSAKLRLFCTDSSNGGGSVYRITSNTWSETAVTWSNRPALPASPVAVLGGVTMDFWTEIELGPAAVTSGLVSLAIAGGTTNSAFYSSREGANPPQLVLTFAGSGTPPTVDFSGTPLTGPAPLTVQFSDASSGSPSSWSWDFGDGSSSSARNPSHTYATPGAYSVVLDASNAAGLGSLTRLDYVVVSAPPPLRTFRPVADTRASEGSPNTNYGGETTLRVRNQSGSSVQSFLRFDLGSLSGAVLSAKLRLFCTDASPNGGRVYLVGNAWSESTLTWANRPALPPTSLASLGSVAVGQWHELDVTSAVGGPGLVSFALAEGVSNTVLYSSREGANPPELVVETGAPSAPVADFTATPLAGGAPLAVTFTDLSLGATAWSWDFGDGSASSERNPAHVYLLPGTYAVSLLATNGFGSDALVRADFIQVAPAAPVQTLLPVADARVNEANPGSNAGADPVLRVRQAAGGSYHTYLRFDASAVTAPVTSVRLRLFCTDGSDVAGRVFATSGTWSEGSVTWANKPPPSGALLASPGTVATSSWVEFDLTSAWSGPGMLDFVLQSTSTNSAYYSSREGASPPELVITTSAP